MTPSWSGGIRQALTGLIASPTGRQGMMSFSGGGTRVATGSPSAGVGFLPPHRRSALQLLLLPTLSTGGGGSGGQGLVGSSLLSPSSAVTPLISEGQIASTRLTTASPRPSGPLADRIAALINVHAQRALDQRKDESARAKRHLLALGSVPWRALESWGVAFLSLPQKQGGAGVGKVERDDNSTVSTACTGRVLSPPALPMTPIMMMPAAEGGEEGKALVNSGLENFIDFNSSSSSPVMTAVVDIPKLLSLSTEDCEVHALLEEQLSARAWVSDQLAEVDSQLTRLKDAGGEKEEAVVAAPALIGTGKSEGGFGDAGRAARVEDGAAAVAQREAASALSRRKGELEARARLQSARIVELAMLENSSRDRANAMLRLFSESKVPIPLHQSRELVLVAAGLR